MIEETLEYEAGGQTLASTFYGPDHGRPVPAVLVVPDIMGLGDHARGRARRLAELGYAALAMDLHCGGKLDVPQALAELELFYADPARPLARAEASLNALRNHAAVDAARIASMGFCYGGTLSLELARSGVPLAAAIGFHSVLTSTLPRRVDRIAARILVCVGMEDPQIPPEQRRIFEEEMRGAASDWQLHLYGGVYHTFTDPGADLMGVPDFARYDAAADRRSWDAMASVLADAFGET